MRIFLGLEQIHNYRYFEYIILNIYFGIINNEFKTLILFQNNFFDIYIYI